MLVNASKSRVGAELFAVEKLPFLATLMAQIVATSLA
jgi:hypothetical protein